MIPRISRTLALLLALAPFALGAQVPAPGAQAASAGGGPSATAGSAAASAGSGGPPATGATASLPAASPALPSAALLPDDPTVFLGKTLAEVFADRGPPRSVAAIRGPESWQDDVEFAWGDGTRFDWFQDRVWRLEFDGAYKGSVFGLFIGDQADKALSLLGQPHFVAEDGLVWRLPWKGYPVQLRIAVKDSKILDMAVFRADL